MLVKISEIHPKDAHYSDSNKLIGVIGTLEGGHNSSIEGYVSGFIHYDEHSRYFLAVKVEPVE